MSSPAVLYSGLISLFLYEEYCRFLSSRSLGSGDLSTLELLFLEKDLNDSSDT